jgi:SAM-dependent methyltransferase
MSLHDQTFYEEARVWNEHDIVDPRHREMRLDAIDALLPHESGSVLDVGAGDGIVVDRLAETRPTDRLIALDRSFTALSRTGRTRVQASADALPFLDRSFQSVLCCEVLEHLPLAIYEHVRTELQRVAKTHLLITVPNNENRSRNRVRCQECGCVYNPFRHLRSFRRDQLDELFPDFTLVSTSEAGPRSPAYPRLLRLGLERTGLLSRSTYPRCPLCNEIYQPVGPRFRRNVKPPTDSTPPLTEGRVRNSRAARRLTPRTRRRYWLLALYRRD